MDFTQMTITEIDAKWSEVYAEQLKNERIIALQSTAIERLEQARENGASVVDLLAKKQKMVEKAKKALSQAEEEEKPFLAEFERRGGWSRFYITKGSKPHIHSSTLCSTCNKDGKRTEFGWLPELSGLSEEEAVKEHGAILCTVCFPSAPVHWTDGRTKDDDLYCPGSRTADWDNAKSRRGYFTGNYGHCNHCGKNVTTPRGSIYMNKHKK